MEFLGNLLGTIGALLFVFIGIGFCIFSHELGHFLAAKWRGLHIDAFSLGFRAFWRKKINGVEYRLGWLPFGGYVELPQVDATDAVPKAADGTELPRAKPLDRIITAFAGPLFNILSGLLLGCVVWFVGMPQDTPKMREITVLTIDEEGPEYKAGLRADDKIVRINGETFFNTWAEFVSRILFSIGEVEFDVVRGDQTLQVRFVPQENPRAPGNLRAEKIAYPFFTPLIPIEMIPEPGSPAAEAGVRPGDWLVAINDTPITDFAEYQSELDFAGNKPITLTIRRGSETLKLTATPKPIPDLGPEFTRYLVGVVFDREAPGVVAEVVPGTPAQAAGLLPGDRLVAVNGKTLQDSLQVFNAIQERKDTPFKLTYQRNGEDHTVEIAARKIVPHTLGVDITLRNHPTPIQQFVSTLDMSYKSLRGILVRLGNQFGLTEQTSSLKPSHMSGPLGMGLVLFNSVRQSSWISGIYFVVVISFALAIFNLFPLPVLDGGHILFGLIEIVIRRPLPTVVIKALTSIFITLLIGLMLYVTFTDTKRIYRNFVPQTELENSADGSTAETQQP